MAKIDGKLLRILIDTSEIVGSTSDDISFEKDMIDATTKDSTDSAKEYIPGEVGGTFNATFAYDQGAAAPNVEDLWSNLYDGTSVEFQFGEASGTVFRGTAFVQSLSINGPKNELATVDVTFQISGPITTTIVP